MNRFPKTLFLILALLLFAFFGPLSHSARAIPNDVILNIPSLEIKASIIGIKIRKFSNGIVTWDTRNLGMRVGHLEGTAWFDTPGNLVLGGHSELGQRKPGVFYTLDQIQEGDIIQLIRGQAVREYTVTEIYQVDQTDVTPVFPTSHDQLTLITCDTGSYEASTGTYDKRLIVVAAPTLPDS